MSGFETRWLDLREPADRAARDPALRARAIDHLAAVGNTALITDLGCGTGSTFRAFLPEGRQWRWLFVDNDPGLLGELRLRHADDVGLHFIEQDLASLSRDITADASLITASALFDLVSESFVGKLAEQMAGTAAGLYAALNYDGRCLWSNSHEADADVVAAFNFHQRGDKGFGPALGPDSTACLERIFAAAGFHVFMAPSPWRLTSEQAELQTRLVEGMAQAVAETRNIAPSRLEDWRQARLGDVAQSVCEIGHWDFLALR